MWRSIDHLMTNNSFNLILLANVPFRQVSDANFSVLSVSGITCTSFITCEDLEHKAVGFWGLRWEATSRTSLVVLRDCAWRSVHAFTYFDGV